MKNLTKNMKIIIASVVAVICVVSIAIGVILINKNKPNDPYTPPYVDPNGWIISGNGTSGIGGGNSGGSGSGNSGTQLSSWSDKFDALGNEMNKLLESESYNEYKIYEEVPYTDYVNAENKLTQFTDKYFSVSGEDGEKYYVYEKNSAGNFVVTDICAKKQDGGVIDDAATDISFIGFNGDLVALKSIFQDSKQVLTIVDCENKAIVFEYLLNDNQNSSNLEYFYFSQDNKFGYVIEYTIYGKYIVLVDIENGKVCKIEDFISSEIVEDFENVISDNNISIFNEGVMVEFNDICYLYSIVDGSLIKNTITLDENESISYIRTIVDNQFVLEIKKTLSYNAKTATSVLIESNYDEYNDYRYKLGKVSADALTLSDIDKGEGVSQINIYPINSSGDFYVKRELTVDSNNVLNNSTKVSYYYRDDSLILEFETKKRNEDILRIVGKNVLTSSGLVTYTSATEICNIISFANDEMIFTSNGVEMPKNKLILAESEIYRNEFYVFKIDDNDIQTNYIMNMKGEIVSSCTKILDSVTNEELLITSGFSIKGETIYISVNKYYKFNFETMKADIIENYFANSEIENYIQGKYNFYFTGNGSQIYDMKSFDGLTIISNISSISFDANVSEGCILKVNVDGKIYVIPLLDNNGISNTVENTTIYSNNFNANSSNEVEKYDGYNNTTGANYYSIIHGNVLKAEEWLDVDFHKYYVVYWTFQYTEYIENKYYDDRFDYRGYHVPRKNNAIDRDELSNDHGYVFKGVDKYNGDKLWEGGLSGYSGWGDIEIDIYVQHNQSKYTFNYNGNPNPGDEDSDASIEEPTQEGATDTITTSFYNDGNNSAKLSDCYFKRAGYTFVGWSLSSTTSYSASYNLFSESSTMDDVLKSKWSWGSYILSDSDLENNSTFTLYAIWKPNKYFVQYLQETTSFDYSASDQPMKKSSGYIITSSDTSSTTFALSESWNDGGMRLSSYGGTAQVEESHAYQITFGLYFNAGIPYKVGYQFNGWIIYTSSESYGKYFKNADGTGTSVDSSRIVLENEINITQFKNLVTGAGEDNIARLKPIFIPAQLNVTFNFGTHNNGDGSITSYYLDGENKIKTQAIISSINRTDSTNNWYAGLNPNRLANYNFIEDKCHKVNDSLIIDSIYYAKVADTTGSSTAHYYQGNVLSYTDNWTTSSGKKSYIYMKPGDTDTYQLSTFKTKLIAGAKFAKSDQRSNDNNSYIPAFFNKNSAYLSAKDTDGDTIVSTMELSGWIIEIEGKFYYFDISSWKCIYMFDGTNTSDSDLSTINDMQVTDVIIKNSSTDNKSIDIENYVEQYKSNIGNSLYSYYTLKLYACYKDRSYKVDFYAQPADGATPLNGNAVTDINDSRENHTLSQSAMYAYSVVNKSGDLTLLGDDPYYATSINHPGYTIGLGKTLTFEVRLKDFDDLPTGLYNITRVEIKNYPYYWKENEEFGTTTIVILFETSYQSDDGKKNKVLSVKKVYAENGKEIQYGYDPTTGIGTNIYAISSNYDINGGTGTIKWNKVYNKINIDLSEINKVGQENGVRINIYNCNLAGDSSLETTDSNYITSATVGATGDKGFAIDVYSAACFIEESGKSEVTQDWTDDGTFDWNSSNKTTNDKLSGYAENSEYSVNGSVSGQANGADKNNFTTSQFTDGTENWLVYKVFIEGTQCFVWLNGEKCELSGMNVDNKFIDYKRFDNYSFKVPSTYSDRTEFSTEIRVIKYQREDPTVPGTTDQYMAYIKPHPALAPNYGTSTMMVFTPYQTLISGYGTGTTTLYEPNSYLSSLVIRNNSGSYTVDLDEYFYNDLFQLKDFSRDTIANGIYQYDDHLRFCNDEEGYDYTNNPTPVRLPVLTDSSNAGYCGFYFTDPNDASYKPTYYKIIGRKDITSAFDSDITVDGYSYYLYLGVDSKGFYRYFLFNVGNSTGLLRTEQKKVTAKFTKINHTLKINSYLPGKDADDSGNLTYNSSDITYDSYHTNSMTSNTRIYYKRYRPTYNSWISGSYMSNDFTYIEGQTKIFNLWPSETYQIKLSPEQGYLIDTISVKVNTEDGYQEILSLTLNKSKLGSGEVINGNQFSYYSQSFENGTMTKRFSIQYDINEGTHHEVISKPTYSGNKFGIYPAETSSTEYRTGNSKTSNFATMNFESFYLFVSNMYNDVQIDVTTLSFFEFALMETNTSVSFAGKEGETGLDLALAGGDKTSTNNDSSIAGSAGVSIGNLTFSYYAKMSDGTYKNVQFANPSVIAEKFKELVFGGTTPANASEAYNDFAEKYRNYIMKKSYNQTVNVDEAMTGIYNYKPLLEDEDLKDKDLSLFTENFRMTRYREGTRIYYRLMFFGMAPVLRYGFSMYASGMDYSYKFTGAYYYEESTSRGLIKVDKGANTELYDSSASNYYTKKNDYSSTDAEKVPYKVYNVNGNATNDYLYITVRDSSNSFEGTLYNFFSITESNSFHNTKDFKNYDYIMHNKFTLTLTMDYNKVTVNAVSKLNTSGTNYQDDNPFTKEGTWFNNVTVTNVNFGANTKIDKNALTVKTYTNWQDNFKEKTSNPEDGNKFLKGYTQINNVYGYGLHFRYYEIPGYYLEKLVFKTKTDGMTTKLLSTLSSANVASEYDSSIIEKETDSLNFSYYIEYNQDYGFYDIYMYNKNQDFGDSLGSLAILASPYFGIEIYSKQYSVKVTYHSNVDANNMSSTGTLKWLSGSTWSSKPVSYTTTQTIVYDRLTTLSSSMSMTGYTFVGWGSQTNQSGVNRYQFDEATSTNKWDSSSLWKSIVSKNNAKDKNYFAYTEASENNNYGAFDDSSSFISFGTGTSNRDYLESYYVGYEFYTDRGYFITDTGYTDYFPKDSSFTEPGEIRDYNEEALQANNISYSKRNESYNFWSAHTSFFVSNIGQHTPRFKVNNNATNGQYHFNLYGIWKTNTYVVNLDANDIYYEMQGVAGSQTSVPINTTSTKAAFYVNPTGWKFDESEGNKAFNELGSLMPGSWKGFNGAKKGLSVNNSVFSVYVTFDTNDWYVINTNNNIEKTTFSSNKLITGNQQSLDDFIIDRYGYSWLGWFTKKLERVFQVDSSGYYSPTDAVDPKKTVASEKTNTSKYVLLATEKYGENSNFITLDYNNMYKASSKIFQEYKEILTSHFSYYGEDQTKTAASLGLGNPNANGVYASNLFTYNPNINFYDYKDFTVKGLKAKADMDNLYYFENYDYLNTYDTGNYFHLTYEAVSKPKKITYYDTSINYNFFSSKDDPNDDNQLSIYFYWGDNGNIKTFRYVSLFAYWETNLYNVIADYRDIESLNNGSVTRESFGSTIAEKPASGLKFVPAYFDDKAFADRLKMLLPTRVGYDFAGWSLEPSRETIKISFSSLDSTNAIEPNTDYGLSNYVERLGANSQESVEIEMNQNPLYTTELVSTSQITLRVLVNGANNVDYIAEYVYEVSDNGTEEISKFKIKYNTNDYYFNVKRVFSDGNKKSTFYLDGDTIDKDAEAVFHGFSKSSTYQLNDSMKKYLYRKSISESSGEVLNLTEILGTEYNEKLGDDDENHFIFMFAAWKVQTFTINVSLNIEKEELLNLYDLDSDFAIGLYNNATTKTEPNSLTSSLNSNTTYVGIKSTYIKQNVTRRFADLAYTNIIANVQFEIPFDGKFSEAYMKVGNKTYSLEKLYATAAGYYFVNWCLTDEGNEFNTADSTIDKSSVLVSNNSNSSYNTAGKLSLNYDDSIEAENVKSIMFNRKFDFNLYNYLTLSSLNIYNTTNEGDNVTGATTINKTQDIQINVGTKANINASSNDIEEFYEWYDGSSYSAGNKKLEKADYDYIENAELKNNDYYEGNVKYKLNEKNTSFYETVEYSNNLSTNFGYIIEDGRPFSICVEPVVSSAGYQMYYIKANGDKQYIVPWVDSTSSNWINQSQRTYFGNIGTKILTFDESAMYFDSYVINFYDLNRNNYTFAGKTYDKISQAEYGSTYGAYYIDKSYDKTQIKSIKLYFAKVDSYSQNIDTAASKVDFVLTKTRSFTMYARWEQKKDLAVTMSSGNNNQNNSANNKGLTGYYAVTNVDGSMSSPEGRVEKTETTSHVISNSSIDEAKLVNENKVEMGYHFYDDLDLFIAPYFNGRFLNELKLTFYDYEDVTLGDGINITTNFKKITYDLILQFNWNANTHQIQLYKWDLRKDGISIVTGNDGKGIYDKYNPSSTGNSTDKNNHIISGVDKNVDPNNGGAVYSPSDYEASNIRITDDFGHSVNDIDKSTDYISIFYILSIIDQNIFGITTNDEFDRDNNLLEIMGYHNDYEYQFDYESQSVSTSPFRVNGSNSITSGDGRIDVNPVKMMMRDIMSSVDIQCRFSIQTYSLEVYNVFDPQEDNLEIEPEEVVDKKYTISNFGSVIALLGKTESAYRSTIDGLMYGGVNVGDNNHVISTDLRYVKHVPTISRNAGLSNTLGNVSHSYNVPYGVYLYGQYYKETSRPVDEPYNPNKRTGYNPSNYAGYDYIYANSYYNYGISGDKITKGSFGDRKYSQSTTVLGSNTIYANSFREPSSLYTFETWLVPQSWAYPNIGTDTSGSGDLYLYEYNKAREASSMNRNTTIIGYYYATDQPKDIKFYTWQDKTNSYELYEGNQAEYTLQSATSSLRLDISGDSAGGGDGVSVVVKGQNYIASGEPLVLSSYEKFGINEDGFNNMKFSLGEIYNNPTNVGVLENNIIRNYWFYENYVYNLYIDVPLAGGSNDEEKGIGVYNKDKDAVIYCRRVVIDEDEGIVENQYYINNDDNKRVNLYAKVISYDEAIIFATPYETVLTKAEFDTMYDNNQIAISFNGGNLASNKLTQIGSFINYINPRTNTDRRFTGSNSYHLVRAGDANDIDKYYPISLTENYISDFTKYYGEDQNSWPAKVKDYCELIEKMSKTVTVTEKDAYGNEISSYEKIIYDARFYVIFDGNIYFMVLAADAVVSNRLPSIKQLYSYVPVYEKNADGSDSNVITGYRFEPAADEANVENIDAQFLRIEDNFYQVNYIKRMDNSGSYYYSPYTFKNTYSNPSGNLLHHYDYYKTNNSYIDFHGETFFYNSNTKKFYKVMKSKVVAGQIAETRLYEISAEDLGATSLIEVIYSTYSPVNSNYTVKVTEDDQKEYWKYKCVNVNNLPSKNIGYWYPNQSYGYVGYVNLKTSDLSYISDISETFNPTKVDLIDPTLPYNADVSKVTKSYTNERIYDKLKELVEVMGYTDAQISAYDIEKTIQDTCGLYAGVNTNGSIQLLSNLITVGQFFTENGSNLITAVELNIPVEISLPDPKATSTILTLSVSIKYYVEMISRNTEIAETIYAVPIYSKNVIEFRDGSVTAGTEININLNKMDYSYFENRGNMYTYYYNAVDGNLLNFAVVSESQMNKIKLAESYTDALNELLNRKDTETDEYIVPRVSQEYDANDATKSSQVKFESTDLAGLENGTYYLIAYYQKLVTSESGTVGEYVIRMGDNVVEMKLTSGSFSNLKMVTFYEKVD